MYRVNLCHLLDEWVRLAKVGVYYLLLRQSILMHEPYLLDYLWLHWLHGL